MVALQSTTLLPTNEMLYYFVSLDRDSLKWIVQIGNEIVKQDLDRTEKSKQKQQLSVDGAPLCLSTVGRIIKATHPNNNIRVVSAFKILK
jgi:hypothetical protein